jgi:hypothetical protein
MQQPVRTSSRPTHMYAHMLLSCTAAQGVADVAVTRTAADLIPVTVLLLLLCYA